MEHQTRLYEGTEAVDYAQKNYGAFLTVDIESIYEQHGEQFHPDDSILSFEFHQEKIQRILDSYGPEFFTIQGGISDEHDEAFVTWFIEEHYAPGGTIDFDTYGDDELSEGVILDYTNRDMDSPAGSVTMAAIAGRLCSAGKLRKGEYDDDEFKPAETSTMFRWTINARTKEEALKLLAEFDETEVD